MTLGSPRPNPQQPVYLSHSVRCVIYGHVWSYCVMNVAYMNGNKQQHTHITPILSCNNIIPHEATNAIDDTEKDQWGTYKVEVRIYANLSEPYRPLT